MLFDFEVNDGFEVVWNGGPLLPDRPTPPDGRWDDITYMLGEPSDPEPPKRLYNKVSPFWAAREPLSERTPTDAGYYRRGPSTLRLRPDQPSGAAQAAREGVGGFEPEHVPHGSDHPTGGVTGPSEVIP